jgi:hypothetical protein
VLRQADWELKPHFTAFWATRNFPSSVRGPVECWAFAVFAAICVGVAITVMLLCGEFECMKRTGATAFPFAI